MLSSMEKSIVDKYYEDPTIAKQISFDIQKNKIIEKYPNAIFALENQTLFEYVYNLLHKLPFGLIRSRYLEEILMYLYEKENHYLVSCTNEIYPIIGKNHSKNAKNV